MPPETLEQVRTRAVGGTFSQALIDEGFASALGVARTLAEQYHLPLVDLAVAGVDSEASKTIALPVLERVCAIPFASDGATLKLAITDPQNVRGLDELRLATRRPIEFYVAAKNDVLTELRRMSRAAEAPERGLRHRCCRRGRRGSRRRRPRGRRRDLRRAARPARQLDHLPGGRGGRERHPRRAAGARPRSSGSASTASSISRRRSRSASPPASRPA